MNKDLMNGIILAGSVILLLLLSNYVTELFTFAYISYQDDCGFITDEQKMDKGLITAGSFTVGSPNASENGIKIYVDEDSKEYRRVLKHEICHHFQQEKGRLGNCDYPIRLFFNELECYFSMDLPNNIYRFIYN